MVKNAKHPIDWGLVTIKEICKSLNYGTSKKSTFSGKCAVLRMGNLQNGYIDWTDLVFTNDEKDIQKYSLVKGDVLFNRTNSADLVGKTSLYRGEYPAIYAGYLIKLNYDRKKVVGEYLNYILNTQEAKEYCLAVKTDGVSQSNINAQKICAFLFHLPPFEEQKKISEFLSDVDNLISSLQKLIEKKKAIKQGAMQELLTGKKRLPGFSGEWSKQQLGDICNIVNGGTPSTSIAEFWNGKILWCTPTDITSCSTKYIYTTESKITESGLKASSATLLPKGALLLCSRATIGEVRIAGNTICTNQGFKSLVVHQNISNEWLYYMVHVLKFNMLEKAIGSTFLEISKKDLAELDIIVPEFTEQKAIAQVLSDMDSEIELLEKKLAKYQQIKQGMMQELLTGRIRLV